MGGGGGGGRGEEAGGREVEVEEVQGRQEVE
jgi:hypothetical protein